MASQRNGTLYTGSTDDLGKRVWEHREKLRAGFGAKYGVNMLGMRQHGEAMPAPAYVRRSIHAIVAHMSQPEPSIFDEIDEEAEERAMAEAEADIAAGRVISHEAMKRWLLSIGTPNELPPPRCGE